MASLARPDLRLVSVVLLDAYNVSMTVRECWTERRRWFRKIERERVKSYDLAIRVGRWLDGTNYILRQDPRHFRLFELLAAWRLEKKLDAYIFEPDSAEHVLPPVPVLPRR
jgi:hypothetical protein